MSKQLIFATGNANKVSEIQAMLGNQFAIQSLKDIGFKGVLEEPYFTLEENARTKAEQLKKVIGEDCFAEDSGLFVNALNGEPGVHSARYCSPNATDEENIRYLLKRLEGQDDKSAYFKTVIHLILGEVHFQFSGICQGNIVSNPVGENGFGYDPVFVPNEMNHRTFAQLTKQEKNTISHRAKATRAFIDYLSKK
jgi:XTP/dITP diphosphohydrolase